MINFCRQNQGHRDVMECLLADFGFLGCLRMKLIKYTPILILQNQSSATKLQFSSIKQDDLPCKTVTRRLTEEITS